MNNIATIEDLLELSAGLIQGPEISLDNSDITIMHSIARQVFKGTALTDRQFMLMQEKLEKYKTQFVNLDCDFDYAVKELRQPLREIDRSKYIKIVGDEIKIRFPFRKSEIMEINSISYQCDDYRHSKGTHEHWFGYTERNVLAILDSFSNKSFEVDKELLNLYDELCAIREHPENHLSGLFDGKLLNVHKNLEPYITNKNKINLIDKKFKYGFSFVGEIQPTTLEEKIATRARPTYVSKPSVETNSQIFQALWNLDRFPIIVLLEEKSAEVQLYECISYFRDILEPEQQSVLFRQEGQDSSFNQLIHDRKLNNWVDKTTKIVYISTNKLPKLLVNNEWIPTTAFCYNSRIDRFVDSYVTHNCDLVVYREEDISPIRKYSRYYG